MSVLIALGVSWRLDRASDDALAGGSVLLSSWSSLLSQRLESERTAWSPVIAVLVRERLDATEATAHLTAAHRAFGGPLQSKLVLLDEDGVVVASSVAEAHGARLPLSSSTLSSVPAVQSLRPISLPWAPDEQYISFAQALPANVGEAVAAVHFVSLNKLKAIAASAFEGRTARFALDRPALGEKLVVESLGSEFRAPLSPPPVLTTSPLPSAVFSAKEMVPPEGGWLSHTTLLPGLGVALTVDHSREEVLSYVRTSARPSSITLAVVMSSLVWVVLLMSARGFYQARRARHRLEVLVGIDPLTQLPNRRLFNKYLKDVMDIQREALQLGLLFVDLDGFKFINDTLGHEAGDDLLCEVARRLGSSVRQDDRVYRLGGDEFTVVLPGVDSRAEIETVAQRALDALAQPFLLDGNTVFISASIGAALSPLDASTSANLVRCADLAVYAAKERGKACLALYDSSLKAKSEARASLSSDIRSGLASGQFHLHYQPKVDLSSGQTSGMEALLRWQHPTKGAIPPAEFVEVAEASTLIHDLGGFVIESAIRQIHDWHLDGYGHLPVAINMSAAQLKDERAVNLIQATLKKYEVPGSFLQVEVTETMLATDMDLAVWLISRLKQMDIQVAVDDFGTGYSSLAALQKFNVDFLKIDRSFVQDIEENRESLEICKAVIDLAHNLNVRVIAEGVESFGQYAMLMELGCDEAQGFLFSRPRPAGEAANWRNNVVLFSPNCGLKSAA